jgi:predicted dehydrogenase
MVRVALVGLGFMGKTHLGAYQKISDVEVVALCDPRRENLKVNRLETGGNIASASGSIDLSSARTYCDYQDMLSAGGFDFVDICAPTFLHADYTIRALDAGYHVFCEKPMALTIDETARMLAHVRKTGRLFSVGQCLRFWPAYADVKTLIDSGRFGRVRYAEFARLSSPPRWATGNWMSDSRLSGNAALDLHIHDVDMVLHLFGAPRAVRSHGVKEGDGSISHITTFYEYPDLAVQTSGGWICAGSFGFTMRALYVLEGATIELDFSKSPVVTVYPDSDPKYSLPLAEGDGYFHELKDFVDGVAKGQLSGIVTGRSAAESVKLCLLEIESVKDGRRKRFRN